VNASVSSGIKARENMVLFENTAKSMGAHLPTSVVEKLLAADQVKTTVQQNMSRASARDIDQCGVTGCIDVFTIKQALDRGCDSLWKKGTKGHGGLMSGARMNHRVRRGRAVGR
jgi:hypothetical protein